MLLTAPTPRTRTRTPSLFSTHLRMRQHEVYPNPVACLLACLRQEDTHLTLTEGEVCTKLVFYSAIFLIGWHLSVILSACPATLPMG